MINIPQDEIEMILNLPFEVSGCMQGIAQSLQASRQSRRIDILDIHGAFLAGAINSRLTQLLDYNTNAKGLDYTLLDRLEPLKLSEDVTNFILSLTIAITERAYRHGYYMGVDDTMGGMYQ